MQLSKANFNFKALKDSRGFEVREKKNKNSHKDSLTVPTISRHK